MEKKKKKSRKAFWRDIKFKYKLTITNENTLEDLVSLHVSKLNGFSVLFTVLTVLFLIAAVIIAYTPLRNYLPGYMNTEVRAQIVDNALRVDSLQRLVERQGFYLMNIQDIFRGEVKVDTVSSMDSLWALRADSLMERTEREEAFRKKYEEAEKYNLTNIVKRPDTEGLNFYRPTRGMVSGQFNMDKKHFGVDIAAKPGENILSTLDGTVVMSSFTANDGYVIGIQHARDFVSVYKQCGSLLKQVGDAVKAGEVIAFVGNNLQTGETSHLHFELWNKGKAVNPEQFVLF